MRARHTPGPWTVEWPEDDSVLALTEGPIVRGAEGQLVAEVLSADLDEEAGRFATHDAALIAAAPEMLEALQELVAIRESESEGDEWYGSGRLVDALEDARAVIARATGKEPSVDDMLWELVDEAEAQGRSTHLSDLIARATGEEAPHG